jgi:type II secretory pathway pseudopilin PulG
MDIGIVGIVIILVSGVGSFAVGRWLSTKRRAKKQADRRAAEHAAQSRQVRRARERKGR